MYVQLEIPAADAEKPYYFKDWKFDEEAWAKINEK